ncbi:MAG: hypothetical protein EPO39_05055 [Candidatus Manganitrophaceae bacterium]|nr:MAG: hypothetical protein EPO39_05055 [Candidatus Manganitrophaceae bacterium]
MDPISMIVTALATGAAAGLKPTAAKIIQDAYAGIKALIQRKYGETSVALLEKDPASKARRSVVQEELEKADAGSDPEMLAQAKALLDAVRQHAPETAGQIGVDLEEIKGASLRISDILAAGVGVKVRKAEIAGDIEIKGVRAGGASENPSKRQ